MTRSPVENELRRTAIVVGGGGGIGGAVCRRLAEDGLQVALLDRDEARSKEVLGSLAGEGHRLELVDVTDESQVEAAFERVEAVTPAAVLVVIAGGPLGDPRSPSTITTATLDEWNRTLALNATGTFLCTRKFAQLRTSRPVDHARIVLFASITGQLGGSLTGPAYSTSKAAVIGFTRQVAFDLAATGITVNAIAPGAVATAEFRRFVDEETLAALTRQVPLHRVGTPEEIAGAVTFLASEQASYLTGTTLDVNGGALMR